jgi:hypothetical protein
MIGKEEVHTNTESQLTFYYSPYVRADDEDETNNEERETKRDDR